MKNICLNVFNLFYFLLNIVAISLLFEKIKSKQIKFSQEYLNLINFVNSNNGYINPKLIPNEISNANRYIIAKEKIKKDEILLFIHDEILISKLHKLIFSKCQEAYGLEEEYEFECIVYFMTIDKYNSSSIFKPYYDYLPEINII